MNDSSYTYKKMKKQKMIVPNYYHKKHEIKYKQRNIKLIEWNKRDKRDLRIGPAAVE